jgi:hypothetical protein
MKAQEIRVVEEYSVRAFTRIVNDLLSEGWRLSGGMSVVNDSNTDQTRFYQAVVREYEQPGAWG